jgi:hypothetical protein
MIRPDIEQLKANAELAANSGAMDYAGDVTDLLAYVEGLEGIVWAVATMPHVEIGGREVPCVWCEGSGRHDPQCPVSTARQLVSKLDSRTLTRE